MAHDVASTPTQSPMTALPAWRRVLVVVAHPDDESFGLGAVIVAFANAGAQVEVLCLTSGEASSLAEGLDGKIDLRADLPAVRSAELAAAAGELGVAHTTLLRHPDGGLRALPTGVLLSDIQAALESFDPDGLLVFDTSGVTGHPDHATASRVAATAARAAGIPVLAWTLPRRVADGLNQLYGASMDGAREVDIAFALTVDRARQRRAISAHASQASPGSILWRRLELLGDYEYLRWIAEP